MANSPKKLLNQTYVLKMCRVHPSHLIPIVIVDENKTEVNTKTDLLLQNKHPLLATYSAYIVTEDMSFSDLSDLLTTQDETKLIDFLTNVGIFAKRYQCEFCGFQMRKAKQGNIWYWMCTRRERGKKCNKGKFGIKKGTFLITHFPIEIVMIIIWNFVFKQITSCSYYYLPDLFNF